MREGVTEIQGRIMVMAADRGDLTRWCAQLTAAGWETVQAADEAEALAAATSADIDIAMLHVPATEAEAMDLPRVLRLAAEIPHMPVVVLSTTPAENTRCRFLDGGADEVLPDNISATELAARMRALMRVKVLQDQLRSSRGALAASLARERSLLTQLRRDNAHLLSLATTDPLTRLQNTRHFDSFLESQFKIGRRYDRKLSVLAFDLDHFKLINDSYGHPSGDYVLKEFAVILKQCVRESDLVARTGGEEFSIVLPNAGRSEAGWLAERIRRAVSEREFVVFGKSIHITTSVGSGSYPEDVEIAEPHMLTYFADQALLRAKQAGRDCLVRFDQLPRSEKRALRRQFRSASPGQHVARPDPIVIADARR